LENYIAALPKTETALASHASLRENAIVRPITASPVRFMNCLDMNGTLKTAFTFAAANKRKRTDGWSAFAPLLFLPMLALLLKTSMSPWAFMWTLAFAIFAGCKWLTWCQADKRVQAWRNWAYLFLWPGLNAKEFLGGQVLVRRPGLLSWVVASAKTLFGGTLLWIIARHALPVSDLLAGWFGLLGLVFLLHFGTFHLFALIWQSSGVDAQPLMHAPILAASLADFWGKRWNSAFSDLARGNILKRAGRRLGVSGTMLLVFAASGFVHELVISVPAGAGYGLPTLYFILQGTGLLFERSRTGRSLGLQHGLTGWCFTVLVAAVPAFWLFHPPFVLRVMIPFMRSIHAL
jgi:hypothetical protein